MTKGDILSAVDGLKIKREWHSYKALPSCHRFAVWFVPTADFSGHDEYAVMRHEKLEIRIFYRSYMGDDDFASEAAFEDAVRFAGEFSKSCGYDSTNDLFFTVYTFDTVSEF